MKLINLNEYYILVDFNLNTVIDKLQKLPENWRNISGLSNFSDEKLFNLEWAGHKNIGWINFCSDLLINYESNSDNLDLNKNEIKQIVSNKVKLEQTNPLNYNNAIIKVDKQSLQMLYLLKEKDNVNYKCINGYFNFTKFQLEEIFNLVYDQIQKYFDIEMEIYKKIDNTKSLVELSKINI